MRAVVRSRIYLAQLKLLLEIGAERYGAVLVEGKLGRLDHIIETHIAAFPRTKQRDAKLGLVVYPVTDTPFIVVYDFDEHELRLHFVFLTGAGTRLEDLDPNSAQW